MWGFVVGCAGNEEEGEEEEREGEEDEEEGYLVRQARNERNQVAGGREEGHWMGFRTRLSARRKRTQRSWFIETGTEWHAHVSMISATDLSGVERLGLGVWGLGFGA